MKSVADFIPWKVTDISLRPYKGMWSMNPSIHFDGSLWRCVLRCSDYAMPGGVQVRSSRATRGETRTKNAMVIFDPVSWKPIEIYKMRERDDLPRASSSSVGYEDVRIFGTDKGGLQGIAASLHLRRDRGFRNQLAEQVLLSLDTEYNVVRACPIRGEWNDAPQKNWVPFDHCAEPRFLYSIGKGTLFDDCGALFEGEALVRPPANPRSILHKPGERENSRSKERAREHEHERGREDHKRKKKGREADLLGDEVDASHSMHESLRGGTQLVRVSEDVWLGIGHAMKFVKKRKFYWHVWYTVDSRGKMKAASPPMKLAPNNGIEFAAGIAIDGDRVVVSFGVDDIECRLGETKLSAVLAMLLPS